MLGRFQKLTRDAECDRILEVHERDFERIATDLDRQFFTIHNRAQLLLGICSVLITANVLVTTGRLLGRPQSLDEGFAGQLLIVAGALQIVAAALVVGGVLNVRWITQQPGADLHEWVRSNLAYRDGKTRAYRIGIVLVLLSMLSYQVAIAAALIQR